ncbi:MAG: CcmD family protein [Actinobacteria bacterium]|nr:CcmD family protein [Actinomycetota bacterium]
MSNETWLLIAFLAVWVAIGGYLWTLAARQRRLERRLSELNDRDQDPNH